MPLWKKAGCILLLLWCGIALCLPARVPAQERPDPETLKDATLVTADGDSLRGQVVLSSWNPTPQAIRFRRLEHDSFATHRASDLRTVALDDEPPLVRRTVILDLVPDDPQKASQHMRANRPMTASDTLLLERRVRGPMRLYVWRGDRTRYFVESDGDIAELVEHVYYLSDERRIVTDARYRRALADRMQECPKLREEVENVDRQLQPLVELVTAHNRCVTGDEGASFAVEGAPLYTVNFGPVVGVSRSILYAHGSLGSVTAPGRSYVFDWRTGYMIGLWGTVRHAGKGHHWGLHGQVTGFMQTFDGYTEEPEGALRYKERNSLYLTALARYYITASDWQPYVEIGASADYAVRFVNRQRIFQQVGEEEPTLVSQRLALREFQRFSSGIIAGAGIEAGRWSIGVRAETTTGFSGRSGLSTRALHTYAVVAFHL